MLQQPDIDLFISYATKDSKIAHRVFSDVTKSGGKAYLYEKQTDFTNFKKEIAVYIKQAKGFCFIDSTAARKADYVRYECELALVKQHFIQNNLFFVLLTQKNIPKPIKDDSLFKEINLIRYTDVSLSEYETSLDKRYDFNDRYYEGISKICESLNLSFAMPHPGIKDYSKELRFLQIDPNNVNLLKSDFQSLLYKKRMNKDIHKRYTLILEECNALNIKVISPFLVMGSHQLSQYDFSSAKCTYKKVITYFEEDIRGWIGLSHALMGLYEYSESLEVISKAEKLATENKYNPIIRAYYSNIAYNKIKLLIHFGKIEEANECLNSIDETLLILPEFKTLRLILELDQGVFSSEDELYNQINNYYSDNTINSEEQQLLADLEHKIAKHYSSSEDYSLALLHLKKASKAWPHNIQFYAEMALIYSTDIYYHNDLKLIQTQFKNYSPKNLHDSYYLGLIKFLTKETRAAKKLFKSARKLQYPYYSKLFNNH